MSKLKTAIGVIMTMIRITKEEWEDMDHKVPRLVFGIIRFIAVALFWLYFIRHITMF